MRVRNRKTAAGLGLALASALAGCGALDPTNLINPDFLSALGLGTTAASLPGDAPGLLVSVTNQTTWWMTAQIAYRDVNDNVKTYTTTVAPGAKTGQMLPCPVKEITLGDLSNLATPGVRIYLADNTVTNSATIANYPFIDVDPFGVLLRNTVNYNCGDGLIFQVQPSSAARSGYQTFALINRAS